MPQPRTCLKPKCEIFWTLPRALIIQLTLGIILFTVLVQGTTLKKFMRRFGMEQIPAAK